MIQAGVTDSQSLAKVVCVVEHNVSDYTREKQLETCHSYRHYNLYLIQKYQFHKYNYGIKHCYISQDALSTKLQVCERRITATHGSNLKKRLRNIEIKYFYLNRKLFANPKF